MSEKNPFIDGMRAYRRGDYAAAAEALRALSEKKDLPGRLARYYHGMAHRAMGMAASGEGRFDQAAGHLRQALELIGNRADLSEYLLSAHAAAGQFEQAAEQGHLLAQRRPDSETAQVRLAQAQWRSGRRVEAIMTLRSALRRLGDRAELHLAVGLFHAAEEDFELACRHLSKAVECDCTCREGWRCLALSEAARGAYAESARAYQRACTLDPTDLLTAYQLCVAAGASARAGHAVTVVLPERPAAAGASQIRQLAEYAVGEMDFVRAFLALPPSEADEELFGLILSVLQTALSVHEGYADVHYATGLTLRRLGRADQAASHLQRAVELNGRYMAALLELADLEARRGNAAGGAAWLERAIAAGGDWPDVHVRLADLLVQRGKPQDAREHYQRALSLNGGYARAGAGLRRLAA